MIKKVLYLWSEHCAPQRQEIVIGEGPEDRPARGLRLQPHCADGIIKDTIATVEELKKEILLLLQRVSILEIDTKKQ